MGGPDLARVRGDGARLRSHVPLFTGATPEEAERLERAINVARIVGVGLLLLGIASGRQWSLFAPALTALVAGQAVFVGIALRRGRALSARAAVASSIGDMAAVALALLQVPEQEPWISPAAALLTIMVVTLRLGRGGALFAAVGSSGSLLIAAAYREAAVGLSTRLETMASWMTLYLIGALVMAGAVRELRILRERQRQQHERDAALLDAQSDLGEMLLVTDGERVLETNDAVRRVAGHAATDTSLGDLFAADDIARMRARADAGMTDSTEATLRTRDGSELEIEAALKAVRRDGGRYILVARDITDRKRAERALERQSLYDPLTELPNRALVRDRIAQALALTARGAWAVTVLMLDVAHFRDVNDAFGFRAGDTLLRALAARLQECVRVSDTVARLGGDEFAVVLAGDERSDRVLAAITQAMQEPFALDGSGVAMDVSIGIGRHPEHGGDPDTLLRHAEFAMYEAKLAGTRVAAYAPDHGATAPSQLVVAEMGRAIEAEELVLYYQPQVAMADSRLVGVEALVRWRHPRLGLLPPSEFVPLIERTALGRAFSDHVLLRALRARRSWDGPLRATPVAVNLTGRDLLDPALPETVRVFLGDAPSRSLTVEVTERVLLSDPALIRGTVGALGALGVGFSIDDFGTGGSSLSHLVELPVEEVKIDGSFVAGMRSDPRRRAVVRSTIDLAHALGSHVVAEGIEDAQTWALLADMGCDAGQGYFIARPMPSEELTRWVGAGAYAK